MVEGSFECPHCRSKVNVDQSNVKKVRYTVNGVDVWFTHCTCVKCGKRWYVQVDDASTNKVLVDLTRKIGQALALQKQGLWSDREKKKQRREFLKIEQHLAGLRFELAKQYQDCVAVDKDGRERKIELITIA